MCTLQLFFFSNHSWLGSARPFSCQHVRVHSSRTHSKNFPTEEDFVIGETLWVSREPCFSAFGRNTSTFFWRGHIVSYWISLDSFKSTFVFFFPMVPISAAFWFFKRVVIFELTCLRKLSSKKRFLWVMFSLMSYPLFFIFSWTFWRFGGSWILLALQTILPVSPQAPNWK